ncbi:kinase D-interacting substrate of 220 kDa B isoform X5 [Frankliniella occidentalis]|uniref:Kinase D-interacting substrate of 220 kDa B isoform X5 n=1 Tax=Frankliniella occidentalis TaxID=133901 RepID=A0A9C6WX78_FRAOC|nr:kinase D-interacting substrate of 220 kDa B isoform X5 [Frankliniella occidentalis]
MGRHRNTAVVSSSSSGVPRLPTVVVVGPSGEGPPEPAPPTPAGAGAAPPAVGLVGPPAGPAQAHKPSPSKHRRQAGPRAPKVSFRPEGAAKRAGAGVVPGGPSAHKPSRTSWRPSALVLHASRVVTALSHSESMVSFSHRTLVNYIRDDNINALQGFLENKRAVVDDRDENGATALHVAAAKGKLQFVRELISHGADVNAEDNDQWCALLCAAKEGHADICVELLDNGADIEHKDMGGWTALMWASYKGKEDVVDVLLERGADINACGNFHIPSLIWAAGRGHTEIALKLIQAGAKINFGDKYGTTALVWACRKGDVSIVRAVLNASANVDTAGMYSWTALLVATMGNHLEIVNLLLEHKPNVNALDKDGHTALTIACKEGFLEIAQALLNYGAYINIQDRMGDTTLIHAVKGGHRSVVEALLKKYADVDIPGKEKKTATYTAVEKGHIPILKLLLNSNPDLEVQTKDGDTALLRAVRSRNSEAVQLLLDKKAKVNAADKRGDTALHIAMRARSKAVVEVLLRNPKHSQLLYRPNRAGETPYNIDMSHDKTILGQIFGARRLNTNEDNENMLGYDLYSSALADILSEPSLSMPITVGLYAKWGSGKSFLLNKLREEMQNFARQWVDPVFQFTWILFLVVFHVSLLIGLVFGLISLSWIVGLSLGLAVFIVSYCLAILVWYSGKRYDWKWTYLAHLYFTKKVDTLRLVLQIMFCHPPGIHSDDVLAAHPIRFYFTDQTRMSSTTGGESSVVQMLGSLYDAIEKDFGGLPTRLYRAFRPKINKSSSSWRLRKLCCVPYIVICEVMFLSAFVGTIVLTLYLKHDSSIDKTMAEVILYTIGLVVVMAIVSNFYTWGRMFGSLIFSQRRQLQRTITRVETLRSEGFLQAVRQEVTFMTEMIKCLDGFCQQQSRLVIVVDGLDACEQDKVVLVLDAVHLLFSDANSPYIVILAIDPHVVSKVASEEVSAVELSSRRLFTESNIGGHDYLRNMVHLPFYLQNSGLRNVKVAQNAAMHHRKSQPGFESSDDGYLGYPAHSQTSRRLSTESGMSSTERLKTVPKKGSRKLKLSESVASSLGSNLNRIGGAHDLTKMLLTDDYFSDVTPRSMRRLMNVVYITGRLLKAFQIDFNWYHLANWVNITEQWPFRTSWIILYYEMMDESLDDNTSLKTLYDKVRPQIPMSKDVVPLLDLDRDEKKFDIFLTFHRNNLLVSDLKVFLPFTINLDPYLKKVIKEEQQSAEESAGLMMFPQNVANPLPNQQSLLLPHNASWNGQNKTPSSTKKDDLINLYFRPLLRSSTIQGTPSQMYHSPHSFMGWGGNNWMGMQDVSLMSALSSPMYQQQQQQQQQRLPSITLTAEVADMKLSELSVDGVCQMFSKIPDINSSQVARYTSIIREHNINGRVLLHCDFDELKKVLKMSFGDWELFRMLAVALRERELTTFSQVDETNPNKNVRFTVPSIQATAPPQERERERRPSASKMAPSDKDGMALRSKPSIMEKQVTLEEQMICGALQTLNEEACEDVLDESVETKRRLSVVSNAPQDPDFGFGHRVRSVSQCSSLMDREETDVVMLQSSPLHPFHWQAIALGSSHEANLDSLSITSFCEAPNPTLRKNSSAADLINKPSPIQPAVINNHTGLINQRTGSQGSLVLRASNSNSPLLTSQRRPSSLIVDEHLNPPSAAPPLATVRSLSADERIERRPSIGRNNVNMARRSRKKSREEMLARSVSPSSSLEKLNRLKEKILRSVPRAGQDVVLSIDSKRDLDSDDENTPLVSELNSPVRSHSGKNDFANGAFGDTGSASGSSEVSPSTPMSPIIVLGMAGEGVRSKSGSAMSLTQVLDTHGSVTIGENKAWSGYAGGDSFNDIGRSSHRSSPNHLGRQDALDNVDNFKSDEVALDSNKGDGDWKNPETSV